MAQQLIDAPSALLDLKWPHNQRWNYAKMKIIRIKIRMNVITMMKRIRKSKKKGT